MDSTQQRAERALERARQGTVASLLSLPGTAVGGREIEGARAPSATMRSAVASEGAPVSVRLPPSPPYALSARELRPRWQGARADNHTQPPPQSHSRARVQPRGLFSAGTDDAAGAVPRISPQRASPSSGSPSGTAARRWPALSSEGLCTTQHCLLTYDEWDVPDELHDLWGFVLEAQDEGATVDYDEIMRSLDAGIGEERESGE